MMPISQAITSLVICFMVLCAGSGVVGTEEPPPGYPGYEERKQRAIEFHAAQPIHEDDPYFDSYECEAIRSLARLAKGVDLAGANDYFGDWGPTFDPSQSDDGFTYTYWIRAYFMYKDTDRLEETTKTRMYDLIGEEWRDYWPGPTSSENHPIAQASNIYLARQLYGDDLGSIRSWLIEKVFIRRAKYGWWEFNSPCYEGISMMGIWNLVDFAEDPVIKTLATMTLDWMLAEYAVENLNMYRGGPFNRGYATMWDDQYDDNFGAHYIFFGNYVVPTDPVGYCLHPALSDYQIPPVIVDLAIDRAGKGTYVMKAKRPGWYGSWPPVMWDSTQAPLGFDNIYYYVTPEFVLACDQNAGSLRDSHVRDSGEGMMRAGDQRWDLTFGTSPKAVIHSNSKGRPSQYKNLMVIDTEGEPLIYAPLLGRDFEINETDGSWRYIKEGGTYAAIRTVFGSFYLFEVRLASDYGSFTDFKNDIKGNPLTENGSYTYTSTLGDTIEFKESSQHITKVNGTDYNPSNYKLFDSPFINSDYDSGYVVFNKSEMQLILDFTDSENPHRIVTGDGIPPTPMPTPVFDTDAPVDPYPSIFGTHKAELYNLCNRAVKKVFRALRSIYKGRALVYYE
jgi:hypothetical protein